MMLSIQSGGGMLLMTNETFEHSFEIANPMITCDPLFLQIMKVKSDFP